MSFPKLPKDYKRFEKWLPEKSFQEKLELLHDFDKCQPPLPNIFRALIPIDSIKAVIVGQDPYPVNADGLCFSKPIGVPITRSLKRIEEDIQANCCERFEFRHGDLSALSEGGIMLINTALTTKGNTCGKHRGEWYKFTKTILEYIADNKENLTVLLWGQRCTRSRKVF